MNNKKPKDRLYPNGFEEEFNEILPKPKDDELSLLKKFNHKLGVYLTPNDTDITENERKRKIGVIITIFILLTLIISSYYFLIYEPGQKELSLEKTTKINELHEYYTGALATSPNEMALENEIKNGKDIGEIERIDIIGPATKDWKSYHHKSIKSNIDKYNRTMAVYSNESKNVIMSQNDATKIVNENDARILSKIKFEKPNTVSVPVLVSRLQAGAGLVNVGSIVDIYSNLNDTGEELNTTNTNPDISGCTVLSIMRYEENGEVDSEYSKSKMTVHGNSTNPQENSRKFSSNVLEMIKGSIMNGYNEKETFELLKNYGIKLSNYERQINLGDLDAQYMLLIETPQDKVNFMLNNMDNIVLTIPTTNAPDWMINEISSTYD
ncbi:DUF515 domain-containing protein [uncultured Methanobrevibacter sp.]|uniref:DUF515 domain-containing protein n=1 Tax=uncultured Methanobrevibacter sp. TaxID=253161 RepID=UPI0025D31D8B|nr:DUF515 domain-containing protein [uncultured Methanobrevibacter sp.]